MSVIDPHGRKSGGGITEYNFSGPTGSTSNIEGSAGSGYKYIAYGWQGARGAVYNLPPHTGTTELSGVDMFIGPSTGLAASILAIDIQIRKNVTDSSLNTSGTLVVEEFNIPVIAANGHAFFDFSPVVYAIAVSDTVSLLVRDNNPAGVSGNEAGGQIIFKFKQ